MYQRAEESDRHRCHAPTCRVLGRRRLCFVVVGSVMVWPFLVGSLQAQEPQVIAELAQDRIFLGESVDYNVTVNHVTDPTPPDLAELTGIRVQSLGQSPVNFRHETIINGKRTVYERHGFVHRYRLTPLQEGILELPAPTVTVDGNTFTGNGCRLRVEPLAAQDIVLLQLSVDRSYVYVTQTFEVSLRVFVKSVGGSLLEGKNPMEGLRRQPPQLTINWADDQQLPAGLSPTTADQQWLAQFRSRSNDGFSINGVREATSLFDMGFDFNGGLTHFLPPGKRVTRQDAAGKDADYWQYDFRRQFVASRVGQFEFAPVTLKGTFATYADARGQVQGEEVLAVSPAVAVDVRDAPEADRPHEFTGGVGQFQLQAEMVPRTAKVGDPLTLTLTVRGQGTLDRVGPVDLNAIPQVADNFRVYEATSELAGDSKTFTYSLRPTRAGLREFPAIELAYFDVQREQYLLLRTEPIPLEVAEAEQLTGQQITIAPGRMTSAENQANPAGIYANITDPRAFGDQRVNPWAWFAATGSLTFVYGAVAALVAVRRRQKQDPSRQRRDTAVSRARLALRSALETIAQEQHRAGAEQVTAVFAELAADVAGSEAAGLTSADVVRLWRERGLPEPLVSRCQQVLEHCDGVRFGAATLEAIKSELITLLDELVVELRERKLVR